MPELGLFPLGIVLLPTEQVPLHIFEPRYRELIGRCLETGEELGLILEDEDGLREVGTRAAVVEVLRRYPDGRLDVAIEGRERFRIVEETEGSAYRTADVITVDDALDTADHTRVELVLTLAGQLAALVGASFEPPDPGLPQLSFAVAARFELAPEVKQELLDEMSEAARIDQLAALLETAVALVERRQRIAASAQGNGKVHVSPGDA